jgi:hypothetical protein
LRVRLAVGNSPCGAALMTSTAEASPPRHGAHAGPLDASVATRPRTTSSSKIRSVDCRRPRSRHRQSSIERRPSSQMVSMNGRWAATSPAERITRQLAGRSAQSSRHVLADTVAAGVSDRHQVRLGEPHAGPTDWSCEAQ